MLFEQEKSVSAFTASTAPLRETALSHLIKVAALKSGAIVHTGENGSSMVFEPMTGMAHVYIKPGETDAFIGKCLSDTDIYLRADTLTGVTVNSRGAKLFELAFDGIWTNRRKLACFAFNRAPSPLDGLPEGTRIESCSCCEVAFLRRYLTLIAAGDGIQMSEAETGACIDMLLRDENAFCLYAGNTPCSVARVLDSTETTARIGWVATVPDFRGHGYGAALTAYVANRMLRQGLLPILHARADNEPACRCYRRAGFTQVGTLTEFTVK